MKNILSHLLIVCGVLLFSACDDKESENNGQSQIEEPKNSLHVASFNIRYDTDMDLGSRSWAARKKNVVRTILDNQFDVIGIQEALKNQLTDMQESLDGYVYIGVGRDDGVSGGEHSAIFYRTDRLEMLDKGNFWYSTTPNKPSYGWDATTTRRICSWGKFHDKQSGKEFFLFNSHFDHEGELARTNSAKLLLAKVTEIADGAPAFCTGDFNSNANSEVTYILSNSNLIYDSRTLTQLPPKGPVGTANNFQLTGKTSDRIDYIYVTKGISVFQYSVITDDIKYNALSSDHFPVLICATID